MSEFLTNILIGLIVYLGYLFVWFVVNLLAYFVSLALKKRGIIDGLASISVIVVYVLDFIIGLLLLWWAISTLLSGQFLLFLFLILFGIGLISAFFNYLQLPFVFIFGYFSDKIGQIDFEENVTTAEILDEQDRVVDVTEGDTTIAIRLAKYFLAVYGLNLIWLLISPVEHEGLLPLDYITIPFTQIIGGTIIVGLPYSIYHRVRHKSFFPKDKRYFLIQVWKLSIYIFGAFAALVFILALIMGTL